jgi:membrane protease YdiL (CAAX protease family)
MRARPRWWLGALAAIAITAVMDATGLTMFSALPLLPLTLVFWRLSRLSRGDLGLRWGRPGHHGLAVLHPLLVIGALSAVALATGAVDTADTDWPRELRNLLLSLTGILGVLLTEEGFFRGWLWAAMRRAGWTERRVLVGSSLVFVAWHLSAVVLTTEYAPPPAQVPLFIANAVLLGLVWGLLRLRSGSVLVASVGHALWNGLAYGLYGFGGNTGALGVAATWLYAPELGLLGVAANGAFAWWLWRRCFPRA